MFDNQRSTNKHPKRSGLDGICDDYLDGLQRSMLAIPEPPLDTRLQRERISVRLARGARSARRVLGARGRGGRDLSKGD